jgi:uncharacterized protein (DUF58 family)
MSATTSEAWRAGSAGPWRPTAAFVRSSLVAIVLVTIALMSQRPDLLVLGTPFAIVTAWSAATRPHATPTLVDRFGNTTVREGDATTWRGRVGDAAGCDLVSVRMEPALWLDHRLDHGSAAVPIVDGVAELAVVVRSTRWGRRLIEPARLVASSPWGGFQSSMHTIHRALTTLPLPALFDTAAPRRPTDGLVGLERSTRRGEGSEFAGVRTFATGDRIRRINWTRSLRSEQLQVNATWADQDTHVALVLDAGDDYGLSEGIDGAASSLDTAVRAAGAIAEHAGRRGDRISLRVFGTVGRFVVPTAAGAMQLRRVLDTLSRVQPGRGSIGFHRGALPPWPASGAELTVVLSPLISNEALDRAVSLGRHGLPVVVIDTLPDSVAVDDDPYAALAWRIRLLERRREIRRVQRAGIPVVRWLGPGSLDQFLRDVARRASAPRVRTG